MNIYCVSIGCTWDILVTDVDFGKVTIHQLFIGCTLVTYGKMY